MLSPRPAATRWPPPPPWPASAPPTRWPPSWASCAAMPPPTSRARSCPSTAASAWDADRIVPSSPRTHPQGDPPMDRATALDALTKAAVDVLSVQADQVTEAASFADDLDADSLDLVELVMQLEDSLDVTIDEDDLGDVRTVANALDLILAASAANA